MSPLRPGTRTPLRHLAFAVVDVETTGFTPKLNDRIIEVAVVRVGPGDQTFEFATLVNPLRDPGPSHIHGITSQHLERAPTFAEILGDLLVYLRDAVLVAHRVRFDRDFLSAEFSMAGVFLPAIPSLCTFSLARALQPELSNHRLATCCEALGVEATRSHSALDDARASARLLEAYLELIEGAGMSTLEDVGCSDLPFPSAMWPAMPRTGRHLMRKHPPGLPSELPFLARLVARAEGVAMADERVHAYVDLLDLVLEDYVVTEEEAEALGRTAAEWGLTREDLVATHHAYLERLVDAALADGHLDELERRDLEAVTSLLAIDRSMLYALLSRGLRD